MYRFSASQADDHPAASVISATASAWRMFLRMYCITFLLCRPKGNDGCPDASTAGYHSYRVSWLFYVSFHLMLVHSCRMRGFGSVLLWCTTANLTKKAVMS